MKIVTLAGAILLSLAIFLIRRLNPYNKPAQGEPVKDNAEAIKEQQGDHYKVIVKEGRQVSVKFDDDGHRRYFFNNN